MKTVSTKGAVMYERTIICLANSRKPPSGRCIAGKKVGGPSNRQWVRPVSARPTREVSDEERRYSSGQKAQLLDIVKVPLIEHAPLGHQTENHIIADDYYWFKEGKATLAQVRAQIDHYDASFWIQAESTYYGLNDKISESVAAAIPSSLKLIVPDDLQIHVLTEQGYEGRPDRRRVRARFEYHGLTYEPSVTDPEIEDHFLQQEVGYYPIENSILCISLSEVWNKYAFRLVASVITPDLFG